MFPRPKPLIHSTGKKQGRKKKEKQAIKILLALHGMLKL